MEEKEFDGSNIINSDNYEAYARLYNARFWIDKKIANKLSIKYMLLSMGAVIPLLFGITIIPLLSGTVGAILTVTWITTISICFAMSLNRVTKKQQQDLLKEYPELNIEISTLELIKGLEIAEEQIRINQVKKEIMDGQADKDLTTEVESIRVGHVSDIENPDEDLVSYISKNMFIDENSLKEEEKGPVFVKKRRF